MVNKQKKETNQKITTGWVKENLASTIGDDLAKEGFSIDKKSTKLRKKVNKNNIIEVYFDCYSYTTKVEFKLLLMFLLSDIEIETEHFYSYCGLEYKKSWTFIFSEGDFHSKTRDLEPKFRNAATHIVTNSQTLEQGINDCRIVLRNELIPIFPKFSSLSNFQDFILKDYSSIIKFALAEQALIAAKLKGKEEFKKLFDYLWIKLDLEHKNELHSTKKMFRNMNKYVWMRL